MHREELIEKANEILREIEVDTSQSKYPHQRAVRYGEVAKLYEQAGEASRAQELHWEAQLFWLPLQDERDEQWSQGEGFKHDFIHIVPEAFEYFKKRSSETTNPIHKARYCDFLWDVGVGGAYRFAEQAVFAYLNCADIYLDNDWGLEAADALFRCASLSCQLKSQKLQEETKQKILDVVSKWETKDEYNFCLRPMEAALRIYQALNDEEVEVLVNVANAAANRFLKEKNFLLQRRFLSLLVGYCREAKDLEAVRKVQYRIVESYITEAKDAQDKSALLEAHCYEGALKAAFDFRFQEKIANLERLAREAYKRGEKELKPIFAGTKIPLAPIDAYIDKLLKIPIEEALQSVTLNASLVPSFSRAKEFSKELDDQFISRRLFPTLLLLGEGKVYRPLSEEEQVFARAVGAYSANVKTTSIFLERIFKRLAEEKGLDTASIITYLRKWEFAHPSDLELVEVGLERYFSGDYVSAVHILVPRVENMIRRMVSYDGGDTSVYDVKAAYVFLRDKSLNRLFEIPGLKEAFSEDLFYYFRVILTCPYGFNLRNELAHGLVEKSICTEEVCSLVLHLLLLLTIFKRGGA